LFKIFALVFVFIGFGLKRCYQVGHFNRTLCAITALVSRARLSLSFNKRGYSKVTDRIIQ
jgi:hypothetical protein